MNAGICSVSNIFCRFLWNCLLCCSCWLLFLCTTYPSELVDFMWSWTMFLAVLPLLQYQYRCLFSNGSPLLQVSMQTICGLWFFTSSVNVGSKFSNVIVMIKASDYFA